MRVTGLFVYPFKSAHGLSLEEAHMDALGIRGDRRWAILGSDGHVITQRDVPSLATVRVRARERGIEISAPGMPTLDLDEPADGTRIGVRVWKSNTEGVAAGAAADDWISDFMDRPGRILHMGESIERPVSLEYGKKGDRVGFADGYPLLLTSEASLQALNHRLDAPVPMDRFRPNLVVDGELPFGEDDWILIQAGAVRFRVVKPCARCVVTTVDQDSGAGGKEPLRTLASFRRQADGKVLFGQNLIHDGLGTVRLGDVVEVLATRV